MDRTSSGVPIEEHRYTDDSHSPMYSAGCACTLGGGCKRKNEKLGFPLIFSFCKVGRNGASQRNRVKFNVFFYPWPRCRFFLTVQIGKEQSVLSSVWSSLTVCKVEHFASVNMSSEALFPKGERQIFRCNKGFSYSFPDLQKGPKGGYSLNLLFHFPN